MDHVYIGITHPASERFERVRVENVNFNDNVSLLVEKFRELTANKDEVSLAYLGNILEDNEPINRYLRPGSTVYVLRKAPEDEKKDYKKFTELDVSQCVSMFRSLNSGNFHVRRKTLSFLSEV
jgi:hypothetical protein